MKRGNIYWLIGIYFFAHGCLSPSPYQPHGDEYSVVDISVGYKERFTLIYLLDSFATKTQSFNIQKAGTEAITQIDQFIPDSAYFFFTSETSFYQYTSNGEFIRKTDEHVFAFDIDNRQYVYTLNEDQKTISCFNYRGDKLSTHLIPVKDRIAGFQCLCNHKLLIALATYAHQPETYIYDLQTKQVSVLQHNEKQKPAPENPPYPLYCFYKYKRKVYGKYLFNDTVYQFSADGAKPQYLITAGESGVYLKPSLKIYKGHEMCVEQIIETPRDLFILNRYHHPQKGTRKNLSVLNKKTGLLERDYGMEFMTLFAFWRKNQFILENTDTVFYAIIKQSDYDQVSDKKVFEGNELRVNKFYLCDLLNERAFNKWDSPLIHGLENR